MNFHTIGEFNGHDNSRVLLTPESSNSLKNAEKRVKDLGITVISPSDSHSQVIGLSSSTESQMFAASSSGGVAKERPAIRSPSPVLGKPFGTLIPLSFTTKVLPKDQMGTSPQPLELEIYHTGKLREGYPIYYLIDAHTNEMLGEIDLKISGGSVDVNYMKSMHNQAYHNIGRALHEFAIRTSFQSGLGGKVKLDAAWGSAGFHFKCGFRFVNPKYDPLPISYGHDEQTGQILVLGEEYLNLRKTNQPTDQVIQEIQKLFDDNNMPGSLCIDLYKDLKRIAATELKREPQNLSEILDHALYLDLNKILERLYYHPEDKRTYHFRPERINQGGPMELSEEEIAKWKIEKS